MKKFYFATLFILVANLLGYAQSMGTDDSPGPGGGPTEEKDCIFVPKKLDTPSSREMPAFKVYKRNATTPPIERVDYITHNKLRYAIFNDGDDRFGATLMGWVNPYDYYADINIPSTVPYKGKNIPVSAVNEEAFMNGWGINSVNFKENMVLIAPRAFYNCNIEKLKIPLGIRALLNQCFSFTPLKEVTFESPGAREPWLIFGNAVFGYTLLKELEIPARIKMDHPLSFIKNKSSLVMLTMTLTKITINKNYRGVKGTRSEEDEEEEDAGYLELVDDALCYKTPMADGKELCQVIMYPAAAEFKQDYSLEADAMEVFEYAFAYSQIYNMTLTSKNPDDFNGSNLQLYDNALEASQIMSLNLNTNGKLEMGDEVTLGCGWLEEINISPTVTNYETIESVLYEKSSEGKILTRYPSQKRSTAFTVPADVAKIASGAFAFNQYLNTVDLPDGLKSIGKHAFFVDGNLVSVNYKGTSLSSVGEDAFTETKVIENSAPGEVCIGQCLIGYNGSVPSNYVMSEKIRYAADGVFKDNEVIEYVSFPSDFETIPQAMFNNTIAFKGIHKWPENLKTIGSYAFYNSGMGINKDEPTLKLPEGLKKIDSNAFANAEFFNKLIIPKSIEVVEPYSFMTWVPILQVEIERPTPPASSDADSPVFLPETLTVGKLIIPDNSNTEDFRNVPSWNFSSISKNSNGIDVFEMDRDGEYPEGRIRVYNVNGILVLDTEAASDIMNLPKGIYIINGKKVTK